MTGPVEKFLEKLQETTGRSPRKIKSGWQASCPAHNDKRPSLSVSIGDDGRALVCCHVGCSIQAICDSLGLRLSDLMIGPPQSSILIKSQCPQKREWTQILRREKSVFSTHEEAVREKSVFSTHEEAVKSFEKEHGKVSQFWTYHDDKGELCGLILRWDKAGGKVIRPVSRNSKGWIKGAMEEPRPLYQLPTLKDANRVYITEGEKAAEALSKLGFTVTTSSQGSGSPEKTDWGVLAGKECIILPDNDESGQKYAAKVAILLANLHPPATVRTLELPDLEQKGDVFDFIKMRRESGQPDDETAIEIEILAIKSQIETFEPMIDLYKQFPTHSFPEPLRSFVENGAKAIGCDSSYLALPLLSMTAAAIGNTRRIQLKPDWSAPAILWTAIVGESGTSKTPAFKAVMKPLLDRQQKAIKRHAEKMRRYEKDLAFYEKDLAGWKKLKTDEPPPEKPVPPESERCVVSDTTVEALAPILLENPRGLLVARDELAGWIGSFDRYAGKGGSDASHWLSMHNGQSIIVDRKTGSPRTIFVPSATVSVCGGIQPGVLHRALGNEHRESGLAARLLLCCPPRKPKSWTEDSVSSKLQEQLATLIDRLFQLESAIDEDDEPRAIIVRLTEGAKARFIDFYNRHGEEQAKLTGDLSSAWSKLEEAAGRIALVFHLVRWAANDPTLEDETAVDAVTIEAAIELTEWFKYETRRVYATLEETEEERHRRQITDWIDQRGGIVTVREVQQGHRQFQNSQQAEVALQKLVSAKIGYWEQSPRGMNGRPTRRFSLHRASTKPL